MGFSRTAFDYLHDFYAATCNPIAQHVQRHLSDAYHFISPLTTTTPDTPNHHLLTETTRLTPNRLIQAAGRRPAPSSSNVTAIQPNTPPTSTPADAITQWGDRHPAISSHRLIPASSNNSLKTLSQRSESSSIISVRSLPSRNSPPKETLPERKYQYSHAFNSTLLALYLLSPLLSGLIGAYSDGHGSDKLASAGAIIFGLSISINFALFINNYELKIDSKRLGINQKGSDTNIANDLLFMTPKATVATLATLAIDLPRGLNAEKLAYNIALSLSLAVTWQLARTFMLRNKDLTSLSSWLTGCFIMVSAALTSFGTYFYLNPVMSMGAEPPISDDTPRAFWGPAYALALTALIHFLLYKIPQYKPIRSSVNGIITIPMNAQNIQSLLDFIPQFVFLFIQPNQNIRNITAYTIMSASALLATLAYFLNLNTHAKYALETHERYLQSRDTPGDARPQTLHTQLNTSACTIAKERTLTYLKTAIYIATLIGACTQLQKLLGIPYSNANDRITNIAATSALIAFSLILGSCVAPKIVNETTDAESQTCGQKSAKFLDKFIATIVSMASAAYSLTFVYGIYAIIYNKAVNKLIETGELPISNTANGAILGAALSAACCITAIRNRSIENGMTQHPARAATPTLNALRSNSDRLKKAPSGRDTQALGRPTTADTTKPFFTPPSTRLPNATEFASH
jgi:hypothetical protein